MAASLFASYISSSVPKFIFARMKFFYLAISNSKHKINRQGKHFWSRFKMYSSYPAEKGNEEYSLMNDFRKK